MRLYYEKLWNKRTCEPSAWINNSLTLEQWIVKSPYVAKYRLRTQWEKVLSLAILLVVLFSGESILTIIGDWCGELRGNISIFDKKADVVVLLLLTLSV